MATTVYNGDPAGRSTGQNTRLFIVAVDGGDAASYVHVPHGLGFIPSWARVTPLSVDDSESPGDPVVNAGRCEPALDPTTLPFTGAFPWLDTDDGGMTTIDLTAEILVTTQGAAPNGPRVDYFLLEVGRTHSRVK